MEHVYVLWNIHTLKDTGEIRAAYLIGAYKSRESAERMRDLCKIGDKDLQYINCKYNIESFGVSK